MRKKLFTFLLALVTSVGLMNAQSGGISVTQLNVPNEWESAETKLLVSDLPGFGAADPYTTQRWNAVPSTGYVYLIYAFESDGRAKYHMFSDGVRYSSPTKNIWKPEIFSESNYNGTKFYYTTGPSNWGPEQLPQVSEITNPPSEWYQDNTYISTDEMPGFATVDDETVKAWDGAPQGSAILISSVGNEFKYHNFRDGVYQYTMDDPLTRNTVYFNITDAEIAGRFFYTTGTIPGGSTPTPTPAESVTVVFEANNNQKEVEVTLPHTFACDFQNGNGELDGIIQELYALQYGGYCQAFTVPTATGNAAVTASKDGNNHYIAISEAFEGTATVTGNYIKYLDTEQMGNTSVDYTLTISVQGSTQAGLQVTELQEVPGSWQDNPTMLSTLDMPGFVAITEEEATAWDAAPAGNVVLIFAFEGDGATSLYFKNGVYQAAQAHNITYEDLYAWYSNGDKIFYTGGGSTPATGLQVVEVTSDIYNGWNSNGNTFSVNALPGFQAVTFDEAKAWTEVPTSGTAVLVYRTNGDYARVIHFFDGTISGDYDLETDFNQMYENITLFGNRIFYTAGGSTPAVDPTPTPSATSGIFANCYDCWRNPEYPTISGQCHLFNFGNPYVGNNNPSGPWKLEFVGNYDSSSSEYDSNIVGNYAASQYGKSPEQMEVYRLYQWQNGAYQPVAYGVLYAYANENNPVEHAAFFEAGGHWGCYFTDNTHSGGDDFNITFDEDASTGFADLHSTPAIDPEPTPTPSGDGDKLAGAFSVGGDKVVYFSKANLQATTADNGATWTWGFAENQWDYVGNSAANNAINGGGTVSSNGPVDLFAWSSTDNNYFGINNSINEADYSGDFKDWGAKKGSDWRTLTINEWQYLLQERNPGSSSANYTNYPRYTNAQILTDGTAPQKDIKGIILFPDDFNDGGESIDGVTWGSINPSFFSSNPTTCTTAGWATLESMGCVFLPSAGSRQNFGDEFAIVDVAIMGNYWSSTLYSGEPEDPQSIVVGGSTLGIGTSPRYWGMSVRLVSETAPSPAPAPAGLQVTELQISASWENDQTLVTISDLPGFVAVSLEEAGAWDAVPAGDVVLIYAGTNEGVTATYFHNGAWGDPVPFGGFSRADIFEWASGSKIFYTSGGSTPAVDPAVQNVIDLINAIPNPVVYNQECYNALEAVYNAYVALSEEQRDQVTNYNDYLEAESTYYMLGSVNYVIETINDIGNVEFTSACKHRIDYARSEYCNLTLEAKGYVTNYNTLLAAEAAYAALIPVSSTVEWDEAILETIDADEWGEATYTNGSISLKAVDGRAHYVDIDDHFIFDGMNSEKSFVFSCTSANILCIEITVSEKHQHNELSCAWQETATGYRWVGEATSVDFASTIFKVTGIRFSLGEAFPEPTPTPAQDGDKLPGAFTVDGGKVVYFSKGNLQYLGNIDRWHFAENQWTIIGNAQASDNRDLFSWGTGDNPDSEDYSTYTEWGNNIEGNWRTLTVEEWTYLFNTRTGASSKYGTATVAGVVGLILLPDVYDGTAINTERTAWNNNVISSSEWAAYEAAGAVFLPAAGLSDAFGVYGVGEQGFYWSSTMDALSHYAFSVFYGFDNWEGYWFNQVDAQFQPQEGHSVRLVSETAPTPAPTPANSCGDGLTWELNAGVLTISYDGVGTGVMDDWGGYNEAPWSSEKLQITSVVLPEGITTIGSAAFRGCTNLASVNMAENFPASLTTIKTEAFYNSALTSVTIPANVVSIYNNVFYGCQSIANVYCYANPNDLVWMDGYCDDFNSGNKITQCHVKNCYLSLYNTKWNTGYDLTDVNVTFVGDLPGDCGSSTFIDADFAINFMNDPYIVVGGGDLPEGVLVEGIPNKDINHGYYNVIITIPAKAGTYKVTLGTCGWGLGNGTIQNENGSTTYASFNQHLADNDLCYHQDPTNNIVTAIFTLPEDQNIIVDCGEYTPYFSIEASSAPAPSYIDADFAIDFMSDPYTVVGGGDLPAGVLVEGSMNTGDAQHGYRLPVITIPVTAGNYKVMMGTCSYSNQDATIKTEDNSYTYATLETNNGTCYHQNTATNVVGAIFNVPSDQIIKVYGAEYTPFFSIEKMAAVPAFTDFEINFQSDPYGMISGAKPEGTVIAGSFHDGQHGYQNVEATVPVKAGKYRLTLGACGYGNGAGNVMSETNVELASFNQKLAENDKCYHQDPANNIVSMIFDVDQDQTITIDCGQYTPYMKLEAVTAYQVSFALSDAEGSVPAAVDVTVGEGITMPLNKTMYKEGYTLTGWSDGVNTYPIGESFTPANDVVLTPVFTANEADLLNASTDVNVKWYFGGDNGAPTTSYEGTSGLLVAQATIGDKTVDVKLAIDATSGKFAPQPTTEWAQVRVGTIFTYPYKEGMTVDVHTYSGNETYYLADGNVTCGTNDYYSFIEVTYPASAPTTAVVIGDPNDADQVTAFLTTYDGQTVQDLTIDRPVLNNMYNTLCLPFNMDADQIANSSLNGVEIYEFVDVDVTNDELYLYTSEEKHEIVAGRPYLVKFSAASQLDDLDFVNVTINNADLDDQAVTIKGVTFKGTFQPIVLGAQEGLDFNGGHLFLMANNTLMWPNTNNPLKPFRAYFTVNVDAGQSAGMPVRRGMPAHIGGPAQILTGVENVQGDNVQGTKLMENGVLYIIKNGVKYNAQGQIVK